MKICRNIDLVQINIASNEDAAASFELNYFLPKSVDWFNKKINRIVVGVPYVSPKSPIDGTSVLEVQDFLAYIQTEEDVNPQGIYFDFYRKGGELIARNLSVHELRSDNPHPYEINDVLDLELSKIHIPSKLYRTGAILLYIFHDEVEVEDLPTQSITVRFSLNPGEKLSFKDLVNNYVHIQPNRIKGIIDWTSETAPCYLMLRDFNGRTIINNVLTSLFRTPSTAEDDIWMSDTSTILRHQIYLPSADVNFDYSYIQEGLIGQNPVEKIITFEY